MPLITTLIEHVRVHTDRLKCAWSSEKRPHGDAAAVARPEGRAEREGGRQEGGREAGGAGGGPGCRDPPRVTLPEPRSGPSGAEGEP